MLSVWDKILVSLQQVRAIIAHRQRTLPVDRSDAIGVLGQRFFSDEPTSARDRRLVMGIPSDSDADRSHSHSF